MVLKKRKHACYFASGVTAIQTRCPIAMGINFWSDAYIDIYSTFEVIGVKWCYEACQISKQAILCYRDVNMFYIIRRLNMAPWHGNLFHIPVGRLNIKMSFCQYRDPHVKDTVLSLTWESPYLGKTFFVLRRGPGPLWGHRRIHLIKGQ